MAELLFSSLFIWLIPVFIGACVFGFFIPRKYTLAGTTTINASPTDVWRLITDFEKYPLWLSYVSSLKCENQESQTWLQEGTIVPIRFRVLKSIPEKMLELEVVRENIPINGGRVFTVKQIGPNETQLKLVQSGEVTNLPLRAYLFLFIANLIQ